nr:LytTR family transcriptional regulator DNA-binding domain-containing protein [Anaerolineae bacterium]
MIHLHDLQKIVDQYVVLDIPSLTVEAGEIAALVGPVGSGKAMLLELLTGQSRPTAGTVQLAGIDPMDTRQFGRRVGVLFGVDNLYKRQTPRSNLMFYARLLHLPASRVTEVLNTVGLIDHASVKVENMASGLVRRLAFGRAILGSPDVLLLMDPFDNCDGDASAFLGNLIRRQADEGTSVLILSDTEAHLTTLCDTIYQLAQGRVVDSYAPAEEQQSSLPFIIPARVNENIVLVEPADILFAVVHDERAHIQTVDGLLPTRFTLAELEERLARSGFFRAHRSYLVNLQYVKEVIPYTRDSFSLKLKDADSTQIPLSRLAARELRTLLDF